MTPWLLLVVDALAVYRLTILVVQDSITAPVRAWLIGRERIQRVGNGPGEGLAVAARPKLAEFLGCPWCVSIWLGGLVVVLTAWIPAVWQYPGMGLAFSGVAGYLAERG
jgi:hypothetical protein